MMGTARVEPAVVPEGHAARGSGNAPGSLTPLNVLIFTSMFLPRTGGAQTYVALLASGLAKMGQGTTVVTQTPADGFDDRQLPFTVSRQPGLFRLWRMIGKADVLQLAGPAFIPLMFGLLRRKPIAIEHHGYQAICPNGLLLYQPDQSACPGHFMAGDYHKCLRCVAVPDGWFSSFWQLLLTFPRRWMCRQVAMNGPITRHVLNRLNLPRSRVIYYGIPDAPPEGQPLVSISSAPLCFAYVGRLVAEKGLPLLVEAAGRLRQHSYDFQLKFIGDGPERAQLERMVAERGLDGKVTFTGFLSGDAFREATRVVAAVVMPSIMEETAGLAAIEQMMRGRLVIASDIGGLGEVVDDAGLKFTAGNVEQLTACMQRVLENPSLVSEIGGCARHRYMELFRESQMIKNHVAAYRQMVEARRRTC
jgi:glycosyltransferase involved in cell wall biosynthesis